jgi:hypothetical protein
MDYYQIREIAWFILIIMAIIGLIVNVNNDTVAQFIIVGLGVIVTTYSFIYHKF